MIHGFLSPTGGYYYSSDKEFSSNAVALCEKFSHELNFDRGQHFAETVLIRNGWASIHESYITVAEFTLDGQPFHLTDAQKEWFERNRSALNSAQLSDFTSLSGETNRNTPEYPIVFGSGYKIQKVFANKTEAGAYGDIYDSQPEVAHAHPGAEVLTGYCVISEATGFVPDGCNDWNATIPEAIQDYDDHVVPDLQRDESFHLSCPVYLSENNLISEVNYAVKAGWLMDYFDFESFGELEARWDVSEVFDDDSIFWDAYEESDVSGLEILSLVKDNVKVEWEAIGEGISGDYDPRNPDDIELLRFYVSVLRDGYWEEESSYCTNFPVDSTLDEQFAGLLLLLDRYHDALSADIDVSVKKLGEELSWISPDNVTKELALLTQLKSGQVMPAKENVTDNLIKAMVAYGLEYNWNDSDIINKLVEIGITQEDFQHAGAEDFVKDYFAEPPVKKPSLLEKIQSAASRSASGQAIQPAKDHSQDR